MRTLKLYTTFIYGLLSHSSNILTMHMTFILTGKMLLTQKLNAGEVVWPMHSEKKGFALLVFLKHL